MNKKEVKFNFDQSMQFLENEESVRINLFLPSNRVEETILVLYEDEEVSLSTKDAKLPRSS